jgi:CelD/BcsL family acetyltransferase involved in cellulose biosynthesis
MVLELEAVPTLPAARLGWDTAPTPFSTYEWAAAWWSQLAPDGELLLRRLRTPGGRLAGLLPLYAQRRGPVTLVRLIGHGPAGQLGPVCAPQDLPLALQAMHQAAAGFGPRTLLLAERLPSTAGLRGGTLRSESSPLLPLAGRSFDDWLASRSSNFRSQARRMERRLARDHRLEFRFTASAGELDGDFDELLRLHDLRWGEESRAFTGRREAFHREFARLALGRGWLRLCIAEVDGRPAAAYYGIRHGGAEWYYQLGRDPRWDDYRVGFVLLMRMIRHAFDDGLDVFRFGVGDEPYKQRLAEADAGVETILVSTRLAARVAPQVAAGARRLPPGARRPVMRALGW